MLSIAMQRRELCLPTVLWVEKLNRMPVGVLRDPCDPCRPPCEIAY